MKKFILPCLLLLSVPVAAEDFLGENEPDKVEEVEKPKSQWEDDKWISLPNERWMIVDYSVLGPYCGAIYLSKHEGLYEKGLRDLGFYLHPMKEKQPELDLGHVDYTKLEGNSIIPGSFTFDNSETIKVKFKVDDTNTWDDARMIRVNNFKLDILRLMAASETMEIDVKGQDPITIPLDEFKKAYEQLAVCFKLVKEKAPG